MLKFLLGFRKFTLTAIYLLVAILLLVLGVIPAEGWLEQVTAAVVAFLGTNIGEHLLNLGKEYLKGKSNAK